MAESADTCPVQVGNSNDTFDTTAFILTELHEILGLVLKYLPARTLNICARVCKQWEHAVKKVKQKRNHVKWLFYDQRETGDVEDQLGKHIQNLWMEPKVALLFCATDLNDETVPVPSVSAAGSSRYPRAAKHEKMYLAKYIQRLLPVTCLFRGSATDGIVGTLTKDPSLVTPVELENCKAASCLLIPKQTGLEIHEFSAGYEIDLLLQGYTSCVGNPYPPLEELKQITGFPDSANVKLILLWQTQTHQSDIGYALLRQFEGKCVVAGGHVDSLLPMDLDAKDDDSNNEEVECTGVAFCGSGLKVASVIIDSSMSAKDEIRGKLQKLKDTHIPAENSIGFMFACIGRGQHFHQQKNVESGIFHKLFPGIPLFGFFGNGEIGFDFLPDYSKDDGDADYTVLGQYPDAEAAEYIFGMPDINHSYTTIITILSFGNS